MAYAAITPFAHGQQLAAAPLTQLADNLDAIHAILEDVQKFYPAAAVVSGEPNDQHYFIHRYRWLWFKDTGAIVDPAGAGASVNVSGDTPTRVDLRTVSWLTQGKLYQVTGCTWAMETRTP